MYPTSADKKKHFTATNKQQGHSLQSKRTPYMSRHILKGTGEQITRKRGEGLDNHMYKEVIIPSLKRFVRRSSY